MPYFHLPKKWLLLIKDNFDPNQDSKIIYPGVSAYVCVCVRVCVYMKKDFKGSMQKAILKELKFPYLKTFTLLEDSISVFQYWIWISTPNCMRKKWLTKWYFQKILKAIEKRNFNRIIISHLKMNSIKRMFGLLVKQIVGKVGVLVI